MANRKQERLSLLQRQLQRIEQRVAQRERWSNELKSLQLASFVGGILLGILALFLFRPLGLLVFIAAIATLILAINRNNKVDRSYVKFQILHRFYQTQIARVELDWEQLPPEPFDDHYKDHPFELDLDITGECSLHRLTNTAISFEGAQLLRDWLLSRVPDLDALHERQNIVCELTPLTRFRHKLALHSLHAARLSGYTLNAEGLPGWLEKEQGPGASLTTLVIGIVLAVVFYASLILYIAHLLSPLACIVALALSLIWFLLKREEIGYMADSVDYVSSTLAQLDAIFSYLESYPYKRHQHLKQLCEPFYLHPDKRPSVLLRQLSRLATQVSMQRSAEVWLAVNALIPMGMYVSRRWQRSKSLLAETLPAWLDAWYELEALCSLANFAYLNPEYTLPQVLPEKQAPGGRCYEAKGLGHPLLAAESKVLNDFSLNNAGDIMLITGSNMAGKSTFLRALGINLCLAYAGGPVNAASLQVTPFETYACIKVTDSVTDGYSYFYAEVRRLKGLLERVAQKPPYPLFFLIDEIFKGTNNRERLIGSNAYIHELVGKRCVGAISTHDLELVRLADVLPEVKNYHFQEEVIKGKMVFDYKLRSGPSPTTNALKIMALEGLPTRVYPLDSEGSIPAYGD